MYVMDRIDREALGTEGTLEYIVTVTDGNNNPSQETVSSLKKKAGWFD